MLLYMGFHWNMMTGMTIKVIKKLSAAQFWIGRLIAYLLVMELDAIINHNYFLDA